MNIRRPNQALQFIVTAASCAFLLCACGARDDLKFRSDLDEFIKQGSILNSYTEQGVSYLTFGDQLARTSAAFDVVGQTWPKDRFQSGKTSFSKAVHAWSVTFKLWKRQVRGEKYLVYAGDDLDEINEALRAMDMTPVPSNAKDYDAKAYLKTMISNLMSYASERFENGRKEVSAR